MAMKRCPDCGERYSDTYKYCPFCEEEEVLREGKRHGRRIQHGRQFSLLTPTLVVLILLMAALLAWLLWGDRIGKKDEGQDGTHSSDIVPVKPGEETPEDPAVDPGVMPEEPDTTPGGSTEDPAAQTEYEQILQLPDGLTLSTTDYTAKTGEPAVQLTVSGGSGTYTWVSEDEGVASVDSTGKVTVISSGTINILVTDGNKKGVCIVRAKGPSGAATTTTPATPGTTVTTSLKAGAGVVANAGNGVRVRSGPSTSDSILATLVNGNSVTIVESAGDGWYKVNFYGTGGATVTGYIKGEFLANK